MPCFHPRYGARDSRGLLRLNPVSRRAWRGLITVACGQCVGCLAERRRQWAVRGMHELQMSSDHDPVNPLPKASFLTLTYSDENLPENGQLVKRDWQLFAKKLRQNAGPFRFLMCGEYGSREHSERPHFHAAIFGHDFIEDRKPKEKNQQGHQLFTSAQLGESWGLGFHLIGSVSYDSVSYVAGYIQKKINGRNAKAHYTRINKSTGEIFDQVPEFALMSRNKGLGNSWIKKFHPEVYPADEILVNGQLQKPPVYYDRWYEKHYPAEWEIIKKKRNLEARKNYKDNSPERLAIRKKVFLAKNREYKENKWISSHK